MYRFSKAIFLACVIALFVIGANIFSKRHAPEPNEISQPDENIWEELIAKPDSNEASQPTPARVIEIVKPNDGRLNILLDRKMHFEDRVSATITTDIPCIDDQHDTKILLDRLADTSDDDTVRNEIINILTRSRSPQVAGALVDVLQNEKETARFRAFAMQHIGSIALVAKEPEKESLQQVLRDGLTDKHGQVRREALAALCKLRDDLAAVTAKDWLAGKNSPNDCEVRDIALHVATDLELMDQLPIMRELAFSKSEVVALAAIHCLGRLGDEGSRSFLSEVAATSKNTDLKEAAKIALRRMEPSLDKLFAREELSVQNLMKALEHPSQLVRDQAARSLKRFGRNAAPAASKLAEALEKHDGQGEIRAIGSYFEVLRSIGPQAKNAGPPIVELLSERSKLFKRRPKAEVHYLRAYMLLTLADIGVPQSALPHILDYLNNGDPEMSFQYAAAAHAAGALGSEAVDAVPLLLRALHKDFTDQAISFEHFMRESGAPNSYTSPRTEAIRALGKMGSRATAAVPYLKLYLNPSNTSKDQRIPLMQEEARKALKNING